MSLPDKIRVIERGWLSSNHIVFLDDAPAVVDTGYVSEAPESLRLINQVLAGRPLRRILNTHTHSDHAGGNALLQAHHGCAIWIPPGDSAAVAAWDEAALSYQRIGQQCPRFTHDALLQPHSSVDLGGHSWLVVPAPGHDHAMVMLWCERLGVLISADALWQAGFGVVFPELEGVPGFALQQATLDLIGQLQPRLVIPGHGAPFTDVQAALHAAQARIQWHLQKPEQHTRHALKVLLAFKLLEVRALDQAELQALMQAVWQAHSTVRHHLGDDVPALALHAAGQLVQSGLAAWNHGVLRAASPQ